MKTVVRKVFAFPIQQGDIPHSSLLRAYYLLLFTNWQTDLYPFVGKDMYISIETVNSPVGKTWTTK